MWYVQYYNFNALLSDDVLMQDMVPGLAIEEFSTPPSSPVMATRIRRKIALRIPTTDPAEYKPASDNSYDIQLGA